MDIGGYVFVAVVVDAECFVVVDGLMLLVCPLCLLLLLVGLSCYPLRMCFDCVVGTLDDVVETSVLVLEPELVVQVGLVVVVLIVHMVLWIQ